MKPLVASLIFSGFATQLTALAFQGECPRSNVRHAAPATNVAVLAYSPRHDLDDYLCDWLKQIDARVEFAPEGRVYHVARSFTLRVNALPPPLRADVVREVRRALDGQRRVDGARIDGGRVGMHVEYAGE